MSGFWSKFAPRSVVVCLCLSISVLPAAAQRGGVRKPTAKKKQDAQKTDPSGAPAYTPTPLQPLPLDQLPAVAPKVTYEGGQLSIVAHNCTLADVLHAVKKQLGADLDVPSSATERVVADLGPGTPRQVITDLLNGTHFNYVIVGSASDPTAVQSLALIPKSGGTETASVTPPARPGVPGRRLQPGVASQAGQGFTGPPDSGQVDPDDAPEPPEEATPDANDDDQPPPAQSADQNSGQQAPKTPEQLLQELQRQQQQMQQQQQGQQPGQTTPPGGLLPNQPPTSTPNRPD